MTRREPQHGPRQASVETGRDSRRAAIVPRLRRPDRYWRTDDQDPGGAGPHALRGVSTVGGPMKTPPSASNGRPAFPAAMGTSPSARAPHARSAPRAVCSGSSVKRLDPEVLGVHHGRLLGVAWALCGSREAAEDLVQDTFASILSRPRFLRGEDELAYLTQALRNTFVSNRRTAARRPRVITTLEKLDVADRRMAAGPEEAVIAAQVFPAIARLPESFRSALVAVDIAGLSYREAARALGAHEATITTRLYRARRLVARELDPERFGAGRSKGTEQSTGSVRRKPCKPSGSTISLPEP
jgi:RNA polymerase sigma-70 factor, ECF subfamily